jgi:hypothetical protein
MMPASPCRGTVHIAGLDDHYQQQLMYQQQQQLYQQQQQQQQQQHYGQSLAGTPSPRSRIGTGSSGVGSVRSFFPSIPEAARIAPYVAGGGGSLAGHPPTQQLWSTGGPHGTSVALRASSRSLVMPPFGDGLTGARLGFDVAADTGGRDADTLRGLQSLVASRVPVLPDIHGHMS